MDNERNHVRDAILMIVAAPLGPLLLALGLDYLRFGKPLMESLGHWSSSALGMFLAFLIFALFQRWRTGAARKQSDGR